MDFFSFCSISFPPPKPMDSSTPIPTTVPLPMHTSPMPLITCTVSSLISESIPILPAPSDDAKIEEEKRYMLPNQTKPRFTPFTSPWIAARLQDQPEERAIPLLRNWAHPKCYMEINRQTITDINKLSDGNTVDAVEELKQPRVSSMELVDRS